MPPSTEKPEATRYREDIDGLRAVAVMSVVLCHTGLSFPGGYVGVDVFFVISGYLITGIILKDLDRGTFSLAGFWERRIRRILPALAVMTSAAVIAGWFLMLPEDYRSLGKSVVALTLLVSNIHFWRETGYFAAAAEEKPMLHTWSLAVEEQFYLFVPLFLVLIGRTRRAGRVAFTVALVAVVSLGLSVIAVEKRPSAAFYLLPTRAWELLAGSLLAICSPYRLVATIGRRELASALGLALILAPCFLYHASTPFPGLGALPPVLGTSLLILAGIATDRLPMASRLLSSRPMVAIGLISYSLYLWHWPLLVFARSISLTPPTPAERLLIVVASLALGWASWRFVETPFRKRKLLASRAQVMAFAASVFVALLGTGLSISWSRGFEGRMPHQAMIFATTGRIDEGYIKEVQAEDVPEGLIRLGDPGATPRLLVWGDSHAMAILPAIDALGKEAGLAGRAATHSSTPPVLDYFVRSEYGLNERSIPFNAAVMDFVKAGNIRSVILAANWSTYFANPNFPNALLATIDLLRAEGIAVYFLKDVPFYDFNVPKALVLSVLQGRDPARLGMSLAAYEVTNRFHDSFLPLLERRGVVVLDPTLVLRGKGENGVLLPFDSGGSFYRDAGHLSTYGALAIRPLFAPLIRSLRSETASSPAAGVVSGE